MTSLVEAESATEIEEISTVDPRVNSLVGYSRNRHHKHGLKSKELTYKHKYNKLLKRKLKKYKLRQDGIEDPDIVDVSRILVSTLIIKSPKSVKASVIEQDDLNCYDEVRPKNYLFKMVRRKNSIKKSPNAESPKIAIQVNDNKDLPETIINHDKKHTNAFKLLMDSRNKSIGCNSPGKEKSDEHSDGEDVLEKKNKKAKRKLLLQKMADAKGGLQNKQMEEIQDKIIKKKMDKRAERLKTMILKETKPAKLNKGTGNTQIGMPDSPKQSKVDVQVQSNNNNGLKKHNGWKIVNIFNTLDDPINITPEKEVIQEDQDFLRKLSPSMKKKESMLSYFKKVDKDPDLDSSFADPENDNIIKVKLQSKTKKRSRKKKLSLKKDSVNLTNLPEVNDENKEIVCEDKTPLSEIVCVIVQDTEVETDKRQKRKRNLIIDKIKSSETDNTALSNDTRPKRCTKRPIKYTDDACLPSSDEELHIFTPKKKKHVEKISDDELLLNNLKQIVTESVKSNSVKKVDKDTNTPKKPVKLAPIFATKIDPAALEAKHKFLQSGVPDKLKKIIHNQKHCNKVSSEFPVVVHIQQLSLPLEKSNQLYLGVVEDETSYNTCSVTFKDNTIRKLLNLDKISDVGIKDSFKCESTEITLQNIKQLHPKFPVYRTYHYLRGKRKGEFKDCNLDLDNSIEIISDLVDTTSQSENPDRLNWTDKYKATSTNKIIGNFESIKELKKWLVSWTENEMKTKQKANTGTDSSDYYQSETDSRDSLKSMNNLLILTGPSGCGKTSSVYAVAAELAIKVIEVNASSKRTGKIMLQDLQEATQSHKVNRATSSDNSQKSQERNLTELLKKSKKRGRSKKNAEISTKKSTCKADVLNSTPLSQDSTRTGMSLILIDDADIVFDQDDGFSSAIVQLVHCSKRPVILITTSLVCPHLQKFLQNGRILKMCPLVPKLLGTWLDIMCLADSGISWPGLAANLLNYFKGDIRKTINYLQFYITSNTNEQGDEETNSQYVDCCRNNIDDENSSFSWADHNDLEKRKLTPINYYRDIESNFMWTDFAEKHLNLSTLTYPMQLFNIWWSVPQLLTTVSNFSNTKAKMNSQSQNKAQNTRELEAIADAIDAISLSDYIGHAQSNSKFDITSQPWYSPESDSVSEQDNFDYYINTVGDEICETLVTGHIAVAQDVFGCCRKTNLSFPGMSLQRERDKTVSRHNSLTSYLNSSAILDRKALALDYWSSCRTICRLEKSKNSSNINMKRNNRFCHYLKSLSVLCKSDTFDNLCDSLSNERTELNN